MCLITQHQADNTWLFSWLRYCRTLRWSSPAFSARRESTHNTAQGGLPLTAMQPATTTPCTDAEATLSHHPPRGPARLLTRSPRRHCPRLTWDLQRSNNAYVYHHVFNLVLLSLIVNIWWDHNRKEWSWTWGIIDTHTMTQVHNMISSSVYGHK
jgi:hypothetical protein